MASKHSSERKSFTYLTLNQKLERQEWSKPRPLISVSQIVNGKWMSLKEIKSTTPVKTQIIRKQNSPTANLENVLVVWIEDQMSHSIPLNQNLLWRKTLTLCRSVKAESGEETVKEKLEASKVWFMTFKEIIYLHNIKVKSEAASADVEVAASYPKDLAKETNKGGYTK